MHGPAKDLAPELKARIQSLAKRICRTLELDGYARVDFRLVGRRHALFPRGQPQPRNRQDRGIRPAAKHDGIKYPELLHRVLLLAIARGKAAGFNAESSGEGSSEAESTAEAETEGDSTATRNLPHARPAPRR